MFVLWRAVLVMLPLLTAALGSVFFEQYASDITRRVIERPVCDVLEAQQGQEHDIADVSVLCAADNHSIINGIRECDEVNLADVVETLAKIFIGEYGPNSAHIPNTAHIV